ncbi:hypothetical protein [Clostridium botulinum]|nr:hypothetical protein [Clostridium botulinum]
MASKQKIKCKNCEGEMTKAGFYSSNLPQYEKLYNGICPICKKCLQKLACDVNGDIDATALKDVLKNYLNKPFFNDIFLKVLRKKPTNPLGDYITRLNLNRGVAKNAEWKDGETEEKLEIEKKNIKKQKCIPEVTIESDFKVTKEMIRFWGRGKDYTSEDYEFLDNAFTEWTTRYKCDTLAEEKTYKFLCLKELEIMKSREKGENVDKLEETYRKLLSDGGLTPKDANAANDPENMSALGLWIRDIEKYKPAEYFEDKKIYVDFDEFLEYLKRMIYRPLKNLLTGSRDFDKDFNVEDDNIEDEETGDE